MRPHTFLADLSDSWANDVWTGVVCMGELLTIHAVAPVRRLAQTRPLQTSVCGFSVELCEL